MKTSKYLAAKFAVVGLTWSLGVSASGIPVVDALNVVQSTLTAAETVNQTTKQIEQFKTQIKQFQDQELNSKISSSYQWDSSDRTLDGILSTVDAVTPLLQGQGIDKYLGGFQSLKNYSQLEQQQCFKNAACVALHTEEIQAAQGQRSTQQSQANQASMRSVVAQQVQISNDAKNLRRLQQTAQTALGRRAAIDAANMLASAQIHNLLQMREILTTQQQMQTAQAQAKTEDDAALKGRNRQIFRGATGDRPFNSAAKF